MRILLLVLLLSGCAGEINLKTYDGVGDLKVSLDYTSARRTAISVGSEGDVTILTGQVAISDETVQVLGKEIPKITGDAAEVIDD